MLSPEQMAIIHAHAASMGGIATLLPGSLSSPNAMPSLGQPVANQTPFMPVQSNVRTFDPTNNVFAPASQFVGTNGQSGAPIVSVTSYRGQNGNPATTPQPSTRRTVPGPKSQPAFVSYYGGDDPGSGYTLPTQPRQRLPMKAAST
jgi:hypothetical protein